MWNFNKKRSKTLRFLVISLGLSQIHYDVLHSGVNARVEIIGILFGVFHIGLMHEI